MFITSNAQLLSVITKGVNTALKEVMEKSYKMLQDEITGAGIPTHGDGLWNAWEKTFGSLTAELHYDPSPLALVQANFPDGRHGSSMAATKGGSPPSDVREGFAKLIFDGLAPISPALGKAGGTQPAKDAWEPFLAEVSAKLSDMIRAELRALGFAVL